MRYAKQFLIILLFTFLGELLRVLLPLPVPASIYGLLLLFAALLTGLLKIEAVRETGKFLRFLVICHFSSLQVDVSHFP